MKMHLILTVGAAALLIPAGAGARAQGMCRERVPCTSETYQERIRQELRDANEDVRNNSSVVGRVERVREALEECAQCALEAAQEAALRAARQLGSPSSDSTDDSSEQSRDPDDPEARLR